MIELERKKAEYYNRMKGNKTGYDCPKCLNRGDFMEIDDRGRQLFRECECMKIRRSLRNIEKSGLKNLMGRYTLEGWKVEEPWQEKVYRAAQAFAQGEGKWFIMGGSVGAGKTHLCTALCGEMLKRGIPVKYVLWNDIAMEARAHVNDDEGYYRFMAPLRRAKVLYIDDLFKECQDKMPSAADAKFAFRLLNDRYMDDSLRTIISSEMTLEQMIDMDEAVGSRIYERSKGFYFPLIGKKNWRLE